MRNKNFFVTLFLISSIFVFKSESLPANFCDGTEVVEFLPHPDNCIQYVMCLLGSPTIIDCLPNQVYDENTSRCEPGNPDTCELFTSPQPSTTTTTQYIPTTTTTTEYIPTTTTTTEYIPTTTTTTEYIPTTTTTQYIPTTTTTTEYIPTTTTTQYIPTTTTTTEYIPTTTTTTEYIPTTTTTQYIPTTTTTTQYIPTTTTTQYITSTTTTTEPGPEITTPSTTTTQRPIGPPELCIGNNFRFIPDPDYCFRFYYCMFGLALPGECAPDRIFSNIWRGCVLGDWETCIAENPVSIVTSIMPWN